MTMSQTYAASSTNTYTAARVREVMLEVSADFVGLASAGLITSEQNQKWSEDLSFILDKQSLHGFQIQLRCAGHAPKGLDYRVSSDGTIISSDKSGGVDYFSLPTGTIASLVLELNYNSTNIEAVKTYLGMRGWGFNGQTMPGASARDRVYAKDGYGVVRSKIGAWP